MCGTQAIDDNSTFCNKCGVQLIQNNPENKNHDVCPNCGTQILNKDSVFCLQCGSPLSANNSGDTKVVPSIGLKKYAQEASKSQKPLKRRSMILPAILFIIAFVLILGMIIQTGILNSPFSIGSGTTSQEHMVVPANGTPIPTPSVSVVAPTTRTTLMNAVVTSSPMPPVTKGVSSPQTTQTPTPLPSVTTVAYTTQSTMKNIVETAEADGRFTTFITAVKAAGLNDTLSSDTMSGSETFTVFAPTDDAFKKLSEGSMDTLLKDPQKDLLQILLYHVVPGKVMAADLKKLTSVETLQGGSLPVSVSNGVITVDGANVIITDIECTNGVIHVVDTVMLPQA